MGSQSVSVIFGKLFEAFEINIQIFIVTALLALPLGIVLALGCISHFKPLRYLLNFIIWVVRGTPLMLQIVFVFYGPPLLGLGNPWASMGTTGRLIAVCIAFVINYACYFSEIFRGGILSVPRGQYEAGQVLGMTKSQIFFKVTLIQVVKRVIPPMGNEFMTLIKDTALANIIAMQEIIMVSKNYSTQGLIWPLFSTAIFFLVFCGGLTLLFNWIEKKMEYFRV
ncbi:MAG: amino acid ABC transporter permease [Clostridia bacterium]